MTTLYGIHNCDTVKKTQKWLEKEGISYQFHDFRKDGLTESLLTEWFEKTDWHLLLNKRSTTYRQLSDDIKKNPSQDVIFAEMLTQPTLIKRPVLVHNNMIHVGFNVEQYQEIFA